jgi:hypothetical protein
VTADRRLDPARIKQRAIPPTPTTSQRAPIRGPVGGREPGTHPTDGRAPHRQPHP